MFTPGTHAGVKQRQTLPWLGHGRYVAQAIFYRLEGNPTDLVSWVAHDLYTRRRREWIEALDLFHNRSLPPWAGGLGQPDQVYWSEVLTDAPDWYLGYLGFMTTESLEPSIITRQLELLNSTFAREPQEHGVNIEEFDPEDLLPGLLRGGFQEESMVFLGFDPNQTDKLVTHRSANEWMTTLGVDSHWFRRKLHMESLGWKPIQSVLQGTVRNTAFTKLLEGVKAEPPKPQRLAKRVKRAAQAIELAYYDGEFLGFSPPDWKFMANAAKQLPPCSTVWVHKDHPWLGERARPVLLKTPIVR